MQGKYQDAEARLRAALTTREQLLAANDASIAESLIELGDCLIVQGHFKDAEPLLRRAIAISPVDTLPGAASRNYLGQVMQSQGHFGEAAQLFNASAETVGHVKGTDSPDYLIARHNLASSLMDLGNLSEAENIERQVLAARERISGPNIPTPRTR